MRIEGYGEGWSSKAEELPSGAERPDGWILVLQTNVKRVEVCISRKIRPEFKSWSDRQLDSTYSLESRLGDAIIAVDDLQDSFLDKVP